VGDWVHCSRVAISREEHRVVEKCSRGNNSGRAGEVVASNESRSTESGSSKALHCLDLI